MSEEPTMEEATSTEPSIKPGGFSGAENSVDEPTPEPEKEPEPTPPKPKRVDNSCKLVAEGTFDNGIALLSVMKKTKMDVTRVQQLILGVEGIQYTFVKQ